MKIITKISEKNTTELYEIIDQLQIVLAKTKTELAQEKLKTAYLLEQFRLAKQKAFAPQSEKNILQADLFDETGLEAEPKAEEENIEVKNHTRKKHPKRKSIPLDLPRERIIHDLKNEDKVCTCGCALTQIGEAITEQLKFIPASLTVLQHVRPKYACKPCQDNVKLAPLPLFILPKTNATPELLAHTIISKYANHIPLYRQAKIWERVNIDLPLSTLCHWLNQIAEKCEPLITLLHHNIVNTDYINADETPFQVLKEAGRKNTSQSYLWAYHGNSSIVFDYQQTRSGYHAESFLKGFKGYLQTDAYSGYYFTKKIAEIIPLGCMTHGRRPFAQLAKLSKKEGLAHLALKYFKALYAIEGQAKEQCLAPEERFLLRQEKAVPILQDFKEWLIHHITKVPKQHQIGKGMYYMLNHWESLTNYIKDGRLEIDNNKIENLIRPLALGRKNFLFMGSPRGAKTGAIFYSLIATCIANNIEPYQYFCKILHRLPYCKTEDDYRELLPQHIKLI